MKINTIDRLVVVILAGGSGTRLWPRSRQALPKQFLDLTGQGTMLQETFNRLTLLAPPERILVITNQQYVDLARQQLPELPADHIVGEPMMRGTAAAVGLGAAMAQHLRPDAIMASVHADHLILKPERVFAGAFGRGRGSRVPQPPESCWPSRCCRSRRRATTSGEPGERRRRLLSRRLPGCRSSFPEPWDVGYAFEDGDIARWRAQAVPRDGGFVRRFAALAAELRWPSPSRTSNAVTARRATAPLFDRRGREVLTYAKVHTCGFDSPRPC